MLSHSGGPQRFNPDLFQLPCAEEIIPCTADSARARSADAIIQASPAAANHFVNALEAMAFDWRRQERYTLALSGPDLKAIEEASQLFAARKARFLQTVSELAPTVSSELTTASLNSSQSGLFARRLHQLEEPLLRAVSLKKFLDTHLIQNTRDADARVFCISSALSAVAGEQKATEAMGNIDLAKILFHTRMQGTVLDVAGSQIPVRGTEIGYAQLCNRTIFLLQATALVVREKIISTWISPSSHLATAVPPEKIALPTTSRLVKVILNSDQEIAFVTPLPQGYGQFAPPSSQLKNALAAFVSLARQEGVPIWRSALSFESQAIVVTFSLQPGAGTVNPKIWARSLPSKPQRSINLPISLDTDVALLPHHINLSIDPEPLQTRSGIYAVRDALSLARSLDSAMPNPAQLQIAPENRGPKDFYWRSEQLLRLNFVDSRGHTHHWSLGSFVDPELNSQLFEKIRTVASQTSMRSIHLGVAPQGRMLNGIFLSQLFEELIPQLGAINQHFEAARLHLDIHHRPEGAGYRTNSRWTRNIAPDFPVVVSVYRDSNLLIAKGQVEIPRALNWLPEYGKLHWQTVDPRDLALYQDELTQAFAACPKNQRTSIDTLKALAYRAGYQMSEAQVNIFANLGGIWNMSRLAYEAAVQQTLARFLSDPLVLVNPVQNHSAGSSPIRFVVQEPTRQIPEKPKTSLGGSITITWG